MQREILMKRAYYQRSTEFLPRFLYWFEHTISSQKAFRYTKLFDRSLWKLYTAFRWCYVRWRVNWKKFWWRMAFGSFGWKFARNKCSVKQRDAASVLFTTVWIHQVHSHSLQEIVKTRFTSTCNLITTLTKIFYLSHFNPNNSINNFRGTYFTLNFSPHSLYLTFCARLWFFKMYRKPLLSSTIMSHKKF